MQKIFFLLFFLSISLVMLAQISEGGLPASFSVVEKKTLNDIKSFEVKIKEDINKLKREDSYINNKEIPVRIAVVIPASYDLINDGKWDTLPNGNAICRLSINSPNAQGIIISYGEFYIPVGGKLFIYSQDKDQILGAYTHRTNPKGKEFSTEIVYGDELTLEYVDSQTGELPRVKIKDIGYAYNNIFDYTKVNVEGPGFNFSGNCQVNINCEEGQNWQKQKKGIARSYSKMGNYWYRCSGSLVNNVNRDRTAFYLSAYHCFFDSGNTTEFNTAQFYFNYEFPECESTSIVPETTKSIIGAQLLVASPIDGGSDGALLKLNQDIPEDYDVYFNGWDITNTATSNGVCIHHPTGDVKKISTFTSPLTTGSYIDAQSTSISNAHWVVRFSATTNGHGTTEGGSSGSPIFNQNGLVVGTLTGGSSSCTNRTHEDFFGKMWYHWDQHSNSNYHMQPYLDPTNSIKRLDGLSNIPEVVDDIPTVYAYWDNNSSKSLLSISLGNSEDIIKKITIVNLRGYNAYQKSESIESGLHSISTFGWSRGVYIVHVETQKGVRHSFKIIK